MLINISFSRTNKPEHLYFNGFRNVSNKMVLSLYVPDGVGTVDLFTTDNLSSPLWSFAATGLTSKNNRLEWSVDTSSLTHSFYRIADQTDSDNDGLSDAGEDWVYSTLKYNPDTDDDGMLDGWEVKYDLNPLVNDATTNIDLYVAANGNGYNKNSTLSYWDTDGDLLSDVIEVNAGILPNDATGVNGRFGDKDGDGLSNIDEVIYHGRIDVADTDMDGVNDNEEATNGTYVGIFDSPTGTAVWVDFLIGDTPRWDAPTERYALEISEENSTNIIISHQSTNDPMSTMQWRIYNQFRLDKWYSMKVTHIATVAGEVTDYDYIADIAVVNSNLNYLQINDPAGILGERENRTLTWFNNIAKFRVVSKVITDIDLDIDINGTGLFSVDDPEEMETPGARIYLNNDDDGLPNGPDNGNSVIDTDADKADMKKILLRKLSLPVTVGTVVLKVSDSSKIRIFDETDTAVIGPALGAGSYIVPLSKIASADQQYLVEGVASGIVTITLLYKDNKGNEISQDKVVVSILGNGPAIPIQSDLSNSHHKVAVVDCEGADVADKITTSTRLWVNAAAESVRLKIVVFSREYPAYTEHKAELNDQIWFSITNSRNITVKNVSHKVNSLNSHFSTSNAKYPGGNYVIYSQVYSVKDDLQNPSTPAYFDVVLSAANSIDSINGSGVVVSLDTLFDAKLHVREAWRRDEWGPFVPDTEKENPGVLISHNLDDATYDPFESTITFKALPVSSGFTRYIRFDPPGMVELRAHDESFGPYTSPVNEFKIPGSINTDFVRDISMFHLEHWKADSSVTIEYIIKGADGNIASSDKIRVLRPVVMSIGDSTTFGFRRTRNGSYETPNWGNPWLAYPTDHDWSRVPGNKYDVAYQGWRGYLHVALPGFVWVGVEAGGHGPSHMGYSGGRTEHINALMIDPSRPHPLRGFLTDPCYAVVIYFIGLNDVIGGSSSQLMYNNWKIGLNEILNSRVGHGKTAVIAVTLPEIRSDYAGYSSSKEAALRGLNTYIRSHVMADSNIRFIVADIENVRHDSNDDGLHFSGTGYQQIAVKILEAGKELFK